MKRDATYILLAIVAAFAGIKGDLTEAEWDAGMAIIETKCDGDLDAVKRDLEAEAAACELACRLSEKE